MKLGLQRRTLETGFTPYITSPSSSGRSNEGRGGPIRELGFGQLMHLFLVLRGVAQPGPWRGLCLGLRL